MPINNRAEWRIVEARRNGDTALDLSGLELTELPRSMGQLATLTSLDLSGNRFTASPELIGQFITLTTLNLSGCGPLAIPESISRLTALTALKLGRNGISTLDESIGYLTALTTLDLNGNQLTALPEWIRELTALTTLDLRSNRLTVVPEWIRELTELTTLDLIGNSTLAHPPLAVVGQGSPAVLAFLRAKARDSRRQWRSKLLVVGEGGVGKTSLLKILAGLPADPQEPTTHGLNIYDLQLAHPTEPEVTMHLSSWDFGGQDVYHATHQFFLTDQSLFLFVWDARAGWEHARGRYWLDIIAARTGGIDRTAAPVIIITTHVKNRTPDLPLTELCRDYPNILTAIEFDNFSNSRGEVEWLRGRLAATAAELPLMGSIWPSSWLDARQAVQNSADNRMSIDRFNALLSASGVSEDQHLSVTGTLNAMGEILHYSNDPQLSGTVVMDPAWLAERIAAILDCPQIARRHGLLLTEDLTREWAALGADLQTQLLYMMDQYDVSYRIVDSDDDARAIVVDRLPWDPPGYHDDWESARDAPGSRELRLNYTFSGNMPPGIPGWFIAHAHRFADRRHRPWRNGVLLVDAENRHGLLKWNKESKTVELAVRGPRPAPFLNQLDGDFTQAVLRRYPGLPVIRTVPCPCQENCPSSWRYDRLVRFQSEGQDDIQCADTGRQLDITALIDGIAPSRPPYGSVAVTRDDLRPLIDGISLTTTLIKDLGDRQLEEAELHRQQFATIISLLKLETPSVCTVTEQNRRFPGTHRYTVRLYCEEPNALHQLPENQGCYKLSTLDPWAGALIGYLATVTKVLAGVTALGGTIIGVSGDELLKLKSEDIKRTRELLTTISEKTVGVNERHLTGLVRHDTALEADIRKVEKLLKQLDPYDRWGGLSRTITPDGLVLYLCEEHAREYTKPSPRPLGL